MATKLAYVELTRPLPAEIEDAAAYDAVWVFTQRCGVTVGKVVIENTHTPVLAAQLRSEMVRQLLPVLGYGRIPANVPPLPRFLAESPCPTTWADEPELADLLPELTPQAGGRFFMSVVVCTRDRPDDLRRCLQSMMVMDHGRHQLEWIVVDNNPDSGLTRAVVADFPQVRYETEQRPGVAYSRNKGLLTARGDIVAYIDDDVLVDPAWPRRILAPFSDARVMCVSGLVLPLEMETTSQELFEVYGALDRGYMPRIFDQHFFWRSRRHIVHTWELGGTANVAIRKTVLAESGLFDETLGPGLPTGVGEDIYMFYRILKAGHICYYEPAAAVRHRHRRSMAALRRQLYNYNKGQTSYQLRTLVTDGDWRVIRQLFWDLPKWHASRIYRILRGRLHYPLHMVLLEMWGNWVGFVAFVWANWLHRQINGPGANPIYPSNKQ